MVVVEQLARMARVFGWYQADLPQDPQCPPADILQISDRRGDKEQGAHRDQGEDQVLSCRDRVPEVSL